MLSRDVGYIFLHAGAFILSFLVVKLFFVYLDDENYAKYVLIISISTILRTLSYGISAVVFSRFLSIARERGRQNEYFKYLFVALVVPLILTMLGYLLFRLFSIQLNFGGILLNSDLLLVGLLLGGALGVVSVLSEVDNVAGNRVRAAVFLILPGGVQCGAVMWAADSVGVAFSSALILLLAGGGYFFLILSSHYDFSGRVLDKESDRRIGVDLLLFAAPMTIWIPANFVLGVADRWVLAASADLTYVAAFGLLYMLTQTVMASAYTVLNRVFLPIIFRQAGDNKLSTQLDEAHRSVSLLSLVLLVAGLSMIGFYVIVGGHLLEMMANSTFAQYHSLLVYFACGAVMQTIGAAQFLHGQIEFRQLRFYGIAKYFSAFSYLGFCLILIPVYGLVGLCIAYLVSTLIGLLSACVTNKLLFKRYFLFEVI